MEQLTAIRTKGVLTVHGGCIHGSPSICIGNAFLVLGVKWAEITFENTNNGSNVHFKDSCMHNKCGEIC